MSLEPERIRETGPAPVRAQGKYVLYWMQQSQRAHGNHALEFAIQQANQLRVPVLVAFGLMERYPETNARMKRFLLEGIADAAAALRERGIGFVLRLGAPSEVALALAAEACLLVADRGYLRHQLAWRVQVASESPCAVIEVEGDAVVPVETASSKEEWSAATLRPKLHRLLPRFLQPLAEEEAAVRWRGPEPEGLDPAAIDDLMDAMPGLDRSVAPSRTFRGGLTAARRHLRTFLRERLASYAAGRNIPSGEAVSHLSPYLHFGHISPLEAALAVRDAAAGANTDSFLEEMIVRRELAINFCFFQPQYDEFACLPEWARRTLAAHARDKRSHLYTRAELEAAATHDPYWNAAQLEMTATGKMHNYMRMYWGKKILEWSATPEEAFETALVLNNRYELDGRDPNSYAGVAWCFGKHDRPWTERAIFGTVRYMNDAGLKRKFDMGAYLRKVADAAGAGGAEEQLNLF